MSNVQSRTLHILFNLPTNIFYRVFSLKDKQKKQKTQTIFICFKNQLFLHSPVIDMIIFSWCVIFYFRHIDIVYQKIRLCKVELCTVSDMKYKSKKPP